MAARTPRAVRGRLLASLEHGGGDQHQRPVRHLPLWLGLLDLAGLQRPHRADRVLRLILDFCDGACARTSIRSASAPMERGARALWQRATRHLLDRHGRGHLPDGVASSLSKLPRLGCRGCIPTWFGWSSARSGSQPRTSGSRQACARVSAWPRSPRTMRTSSAYCGIAPRDTLYPAHRPA
jgi:hypothetical protein